VEYKKDFDGWNKKQQYIENQKPLFFTEREIWWCQLGVNTGSEQDGKGEFFERPVLVIKKINDHIGWVLPFSTKRRNDRYRFNIKDLRMQLILSQIRTVDSRRFLRRIDTIDNSIFQEILSAMRSLIKSETPLSG
jgi:mRNA interferase MazF